MLTNVSAKLNASYKFSKRRVRKTGKKLKGTKFGTIASEYVKMQFLPLGNSNIFFSWISIRNG